MPNTDVDPFAAQSQAATLLGDVIFALNLSTEHRAALQDAMGRWMHAVANASHASASRAAVALTEGVRTRLDVIEKEQREQATAIKALLGVVRGQS